MIYYEHAHSDITISTVMLWRDGGGVKERWWWSEKERQTDRKAELKWDEKRGTGDERGGCIQ